MATLNRNVATNRNVVTAKTGHNISKLQILTEYVLTTFSDHNISVRDQNSIQYGQNFSKCPVDQIMSRQLSIPCLWAMGLVGVAFCC